MRLEKFDRQLQLMLLLTQNVEYTVDELADKLTLSRRSIYLYLEGFKEAGFVVEKQHGCYRLDKSSPFFRKVTELVHFTEDEALVLRDLLEGVEGQDVQIQHLKQKLCRLYDFGILQNVTLNEQMARNVRNLYTAIKERRQVMLRHYSSANSDQTAHRVVEPFAFLSGNGEIRCYELSSGQNKTFKVSRIGEVELLDLLWSYSASHIPVYTDLFGFSGEERELVVLRLRRLAANVLREEYPRSVHCLTAEDEDHWILRVEVCSYKGIGRFVLGLFEQVELVESKGFSDYLQEKSKLLTKKFDL